MTAKSHSAHRRQRLAGKRNGGENPGGRGMEQARQLICTEAARIMAEEGVQDYHSAKRKAANRLNQPEMKNLPSNQEIEDALTRHLQLFHAQDLPRTLHKLRSLARDAMDMLRDFEPKLVGAALSGNVTRYSEIQLHVAADTPEDIAFLLQDRQIPYEEASRHVRFGGDRHENLPAYRFTADGTIIELTVFTRLGAREAPLSPVDGKPMRRAGMRELASLLADPPSHTPG
jgi:hypothetical protein